MQAQQFPALRDVQQQIISAEDHMPKSLEATSTEARQGILFGRKELLLLSFLLKRRFSSLPRIDRSPAVRCGSIDLPTETIIILPPEKGSWKNNQIHFRNVKGLFSRIINTSLGRWVQAELLGSSLAGDEQLRAI